MEQKIVVDILKTWQNLNPNPKGELDYVNTYTLLVAIALSAQSTDVSVNKATKPLFEKITTPQQMLDLGEEKLIEYIRSIGLYKTKAKNVILMAQQLVDTHDSQVPNNQKELEALPGVGKKTANVLRNIAFGEPTIAVDTHVFRVGNRTGMAVAKNVAETEKILTKVIPDEYKVPSHHWMILHGRYICKSRKPECYKCPISQYCEEYQSKAQEFDFSN